MSRASLIEKLYVKHKSAFEFDFDKLNCGVPMASVLSITDLGDLNYIATSAKYSGRARKKFKYMDDIMNRRGFRRKFAGTNRLIYDFLDYPTFIAKVGFDRIGSTDANREFINQQYIKPFCNKIFEVDYTGTTCFVEKVNPITSIYEFLSVADDIFNMLLTNIIGKYILDDIGVSKYMNYGIRHLANGCTFGPVLVDFPYLYKLDGNKLICQRPVVGPDGKFYKCGGDIDYDSGFNAIKCCKCGKLYSAMDLAIDDSNTLMVYDDSSKGDHIMRARVVEHTKDGKKVILDTGNVSESYKPEEIKLGRFVDDSIHEYPVSKTIKGKKMRHEEIISQTYSKLQQEVYKKHVASETDKEYMYTKVKTTKDGSPVSVLPINAEEPKILGAFKYGNICNNPILVTSVNGCKVMEERVMPEIKLNADMRKIEENPLKNFSHDIAEYIKEVVREDNESGNMEPADSVYNSEGSVPDNSQEVEEDNDGRDNNSSDVSANGNITGTANGSVSELASEESINELIKKWRS